MSTKQINTDLFSKGHVGKLKSVLRKSISGIWVADPYKINIYNIDIIYRYCYYLVYPIGINIFPVGYSVFPIAYSLLAIPYWLFMECSRPGPLHVMLRVFVL